MHQFTVLARRHSLALVEDAAQAHGASLHGRPAPRLLRNQGMSSPYHYQLIGLNGRMNDISAAIARTELGQPARHWLTRPSAGPSPAWRPR